MRSEKKKDAKKEVKKKNEDGGGGGGEEEELGVPGHRFQLPVCLLWCPETREREKKKGREKSDKGTK
ncbi:hypothetical protein EYF80_038587 [Liparis tanakae]|uniref:Uncharacterized protein n=1 Tax=Liparis tanakae TaxID=230148 RepID=A0A4Z2GE93_9TELE|nr:hypothetical protein EYF80_038587 [Liparis tanakae]